jgi:hypothetical protein
LTIVFVFPSSSIKGAPFLLLVIDISLKEIPFVTPVPSALTKASFAANLFE